MFAKLYDCRVYDKFALILLLNKFIGSLKFERAKILCSFAKTSLAPVQFLVLKTQFGPLSWLEIINADWSRLAINVNQPVQVQHAIGMNVADGVNHTAIRGVRSSEVVTRVLV